MQIEQAARPGQAALGPSQVAEQDVLDQARESIDNFDPDVERTRRVDLTNEVICTIDPDDAKDYDDAISLRYREDTGYWELGVHIADVSYFVPAGSALDEDAFDITCSDQSDLEVRGGGGRFQRHVV